MKNLALVSKMAWLIVSLLACQDPNRVIIEKAPRPLSSPSPAPSCSTAIIGDKDGFGRGFKDGYALSIAGGTSLPLDWRNQDPTFTDIYPADIDANGNTTHQISYVMKFHSPGNISSAILRLNTLGIQDGDAQICGSDTDIRLFLDGKEIPGAFDKVDQFDQFNGQWADFASVIEVPIPANLLYVLSDGELAVRWEIRQMTPGTPSYDSFAIDYCELVICSSSDR